jgi:hypothetical protein
MAAFFDPKTCIYLTEDEKSSVEVELNIIYPSPRRTRSSLSQAINQSEANDLSDDHNIIDLFAKDLGKSKFK